MYTAIPTKPPLRRVTIRPLCKPFPPPLLSSLPPSDPSTLDSLPHRFHLYPRGALIAPPLAASHFTIISWVMGSRCARARSPPRQSPVNARAFGVASRSKTRSLSDPADSRRNCFTAREPFHPEGRSCGQVSRIFLNANYAH